MKNRGLFGVLLWTVTACWLLPLVAAALSAFRTPQAILTDPAQIDLEHLSLRSLMSFFADGRWRWVTNSLQLAAVAIAITLPTALLLSYAIGRMRSRIGYTVLRLLMFGFLIPSAFLAIPVLDTVTRLDIGARNIATAVVVSATATPACAWIMLQAIRQIPHQLFESATIDGIPTTVLFRRLIIPSILPSLGASLMLTFALGWGESTVSASLTAGRTGMPLAAAVPLLLAGDVWRWDVILPAIVIMSVPSLLATVGTGLILRRRGIW